MSCNKRFDPDSVTEQKLLDELLILSNTLGRTPSRRDMLNGTSITKRLYLYDRKFGGLSEACLKVGLVINKGGFDLQYTDKELLDHILDLKKSLNRTPTQEDINNAGKYAIGAYKRHFGTYNKALKQLNIRHNMRHDVTEQEIIDDIIRVSNILGASPTGKLFDEMSQTVCWKSATIKTNNNFNWNALLKQCGLKVLNNRNITEPELKYEIEKLKTQLNRLPGYYDMLQLGAYSPETYAERFGSYLLALKHFGYDYVPDSQWQNQTYTSGKDGTLYKSKFEANIADALFDMKGANKILSYEYEKQVCSDRKWTCDFYIKTNDKEWWLEADGMGKNRFDPYEDGNEKIDFYTTNNYMFLIIPYRKLDLQKYIERLLNI